MPGRLEEMWEHLHSVQFVYPTGAVSITVTSAGGAWTLGAFSADIIAAGAIASAYDIHGVYVSNPTANAEYEIVLYYGAADVECARMKFVRTAVFVNSIFLPIVTGTSDHNFIPYGSRLRAKIMDSVGGSAANISVFGHAYH